jgi:hypothetical protein
LFKGKIAMKINLNPLLLLLCVLLTIALFTSSALSQDSDTMTLHVVERATTDVVTDLGEEGDSVGDVLTFANEVYDENNETLVGTDNGFCVRTVVGAAWECIWTLTLADGQITVEGPFNDTGESVFAVTGGTGAYANARGQMTLTWRNDAGTEFDFVYEISN